MTSSARNLRLLILGASGHGKVVADCARAFGRWGEILFFDDRSADIGTCEDWTVAGDGEAFLSAAAEDDCEAFVAIGNAAVRLRWLEAAREAGASLATIIHPSSVLSGGATLGDGVIVAPGGIVNIASWIGLGCIVNTGASVDHDCRLEAGVHVCPGARLAGDVQVGQRSWIGIGAVVRQGVRIGSDVTVGAGAAVVQDVGDGLTVVGVPARPLAHSKD